MDFDKVDLICVSAKEGTYTQVLQQIVAVSLLVQNMDISKAIGVMVFQPRENSELFGNIAERGSNIFGDVFTGRVISLIFNSQAVS